MWIDLENTEENSEKIGKIQKKGKFKSENILKMWKKIVNDMKNIEER